VQHGFKSHSLSFWFVTGISCENKGTRNTYMYSGEGPRSRRHGRTAALRLIVQPYDEGDDDDYYYFLSFS
jgi:hypothetical protein